MFDEEVSRRIPDRKQITGKETTIAFRENDVMVYLP